mgnify:CR=1 FL=1
MKQDFSSFYIDKNNKVAFDIIKNIADNKQTNYSTILLCGKNGVGKSHLMVALEQAAKGKSNIVRISSNQFIKMLKNKAICSLYNVDILIIEDVQFFVSTMKNEKEIYNSIKKLTIDKSITIIMTIDKEIRDLENLEFISKLMQINYERNLILEIKATLTNKTKRLIIKEFQNRNSIIIAESKIKTLLKECIGYQELQSKLNATKILSK